MPLTVVYLKSLTQGRDTLKEQLMQIGFFVVTFDVVAAAEIALLYPAISILIVNCTGTTAHERLKWAKEQHNKGVKVILIGKNLGVKDIPQFVPSTNLAHEIAAKIHELCP